MPAPSIGLGLALLLALVQAITEFLPVSSSGHLRLLEAVAGVRGAQTTLDVMLHGGTLLAVVWFYRVRLAAMARDSLAALRGPRAGEPRAGARLAVLLVAGTVVTGLVGVPLGHWTEAHLSSVPAVGAALLVNGAILWATRARSDERGRALEEVGWVDVLVVGVAQGLAVTRGLSRSGLTIAAALAVGIDRSAAAALSFLLAIPAIAGAVVLELPHLAGDTATVAPLTVLLAAALAAVAGYAALAWLVRVVERGHLHRFAPWCWAVGAAALLWYEWVQ